MAKFPGDFLCVAEVQGSLLYVADHRRDLLCVTEVRRHLLYILGQVSGVLPKLTEVKENLLYDAEVWGCLLCVAEVPGGPHRLTPMEELIWSGPGG